MARINLNIPDDLAERVRSRFPGEMSKIAQGAFEQVVSAMEAGAAPPQKDKPQISGVPTSLPVKDGVLWNNGGVLCISGSD